jgi:putative endonuclease
MSQARRSIGERGEDLAVAYLEEQGWTIRERNFRTSFGEIDIIAQREVRRGQGLAQSIIFVEVKARRSTASVRPEASVTAKKRKTLVRLGRYYATRHGLTTTIMRFDVIAVDLGQDPAHIDHYRGAFDGQGRIR